MKCKVCNREFQWLRVEGKKVIGDVCEDCLPDILDWQAYQRLTAGTAEYKRDKRIEYLALGLGSEAGEVQGKVKKWIRGDKRGLDKEAIKKELGDVLWYVARLADELGISLKEIAITNLIKLYNRKERGKIKGDGDER